MAYINDNVDEIESAYQRRREMREFFEESEKVDKKNKTNRTCPIRRSCSLIKDVLGEINPLLGIYNYPKTYASKVRMDLCTGNSEPMFHCCELYPRQSKIIENSLIGIRRKIQKHMAGREHLEEA